MNKNLGFLILFLLFFTSSCKKHDQVSIVGIDDQGKELVVNVDGKKFIQFTSEMFINTHNETLSLLENTENPNWSLEKIEVGIGVNLTVGADKLWKWNYNPGYKLVYVKTHN